MLIDLEALRERTADDEELLREVLSDFIGAADSMLREIAEASDGRAAHRLRGALLALCVRRAAEAAGEVEAARSEQNLERLRAVVAATIGEMRAYLA